MEPSSDAALEALAPERLVVGIDFGDTGTRALQHALALAARRSDTRVEIVVVCLGSRPRVRLDTPDGTRTVTVDEAAEFLLAYVKDQLAQFQASHGVDVDESRITTHVRVGAPAEELCRVGAEVDADLVLVGTHGRKGLGRLLLGSVAEEVVAKAGCPVFVVKE